VHISEDQLEKLPPYTNQPVEMNNFLMFLMESQGRWPVDQVMEDREVKG
jgi:hypothetical protein